MQELLSKIDISSSELMTLLDGREKGEVEFVLIDVREQYEYDDEHIKGVDMLKPTSVFKTWAETIFNQYEDKYIIFTCRTGARSAQIQNVFKSSGHDKALNHFDGIVTYGGQRER
jgi:rhodanese-related sulfurtransferase